MGSETQITNIFIGIVQKDASGESGLKPDREAGRLPDIGTGFILK